jgi:predicted Kef-type K+ transport protein
VSTEASLVILLAGGALIAWILNLVRGGRLYVGYAVIFGVAISTACVVVALPSLLGMSAILRAHREGLAIGAAIFVVLILVYALGQLTILSNRLTTLTQELAIRHADESSSRDVPSPRE